MLRVIAIDKIKDINYKNTINDFLQRLNNRLKIDIFELQPAKYINFDCKEKAIDKEAEKILESLNYQDYVITLDDKGKHLSSHEFSTLVFDTLNHKHITFIIGGAYGVSPKIKEKSNLLLSLSKMTFPHELARLILIEQMYRAYCINSNIKYHH